MVVKKFHGSSTREVLRQVRDELGPDALILSNRQMPDGKIEIMAVADTDISSLAAPPAVPPLRTTPRTDVPPAAAARPAPASGAKPPANTAPTNKTPLNVQPPRPPAGAINRAVQRTYAVPPELSDDDEPSLADIRRGNNAPSPPPARDPSRDPSRDAIARHEPLTNPPFILRPGSDAPRARPAVPPPEPEASPSGDSAFKARYRYEPPESQAPVPQRVEPVLEDAAPPPEPVARKVLPVENGPALAPQSYAAETPATRPTPLPSQPEPAPGVPAPQLESLSSDVEDISQEIKLLRNLLEGQLAGLAWNELKRQDPERLEVLRRLLGVGFSPALARQIVEHMPPGYSTERGMKWARTALQHNLPTVGVGGDIVESGGVFALVGPTGVGKTTTVAKLAARATLRHGAARLALITTDGYRIGAQDQLRIYGKILGVPVYAVTDEADLRQTLADLHNRHLVLIDTVGMSQRDQRVVEQIALLAGQTSPVKRLLLLSANAQGSTLDDVVRRYHGKGLDGCIFTKTDEAFSLGSGLDVIVRYKLPLYYITNGQRVPEDLHVASGAYLIDRLFKTPPQAPAYRLKNEEYPLYIGAQPNLDFSWRDAG